MRRASLAGGLWAATLGACAWGPGGPMGEVTTTLEVAWDVPADRDAGGGWQRLASDYQIQLDTATWTAAHLALIDTGAAALAFDPANPPPGYSLCHNGHCHATDGRLVAYEDISAELSGGTAAGPVLELAVGDLDLVAGASLELTCAGVPCALPLATVGRVELEVTAIALAGRVRDGQQPPRIAEVAFTVALALDAHAVGRISLPIDRSAPPRIELAVAARPTAALLDGVDWTTFGGPAPIDLAGSPAAVSAITTALGELELGLDARRRD